VTRGSPGGEIRIVHCSFQTPAARLEVTWPGIVGVGALFLFALHGCNSGGPVSKPPEPGRSNFANRPQRG